jgi:hypothetical protein
LLFNLFNDELSINHATEYRIIFLNEGMGNISKALKAGLLPLQLLKISGENGEKITVNGVGVNIRV